MPHSEMVNALVTVLLVGLTDAVSDSTATHRQAVEAIYGLLEGKLLRPVRTKR